MSGTTPRSLPYTGDPDADALLARDPLALLIGFVLDQQVSLQKAFSGPLELQRRIGVLDATVISEMDPGELEATFRSRPALHRFPAHMAHITQQLCRAIAATYAGDAARVWTEARDGPDLLSRLLALPGIGEMKARTLVAVLSKRFGVVLPGVERVMPTHPTLGDVDSAEALAAYREYKRLRKAGQPPAGGRTGTDA
jgi:uncharacterized HhH-GPD family protein